MLQVLLGRSLREVPRAFPVPELSTACAGLWSRGLRGTPSGAEKASQTTTSIRPPDAAQQSSREATAFEQHVRDVSAPHKTGWASVPALPKFLGLAGLIPFYAFSPPVVKVIAEQCSGIAAISGPLQELLPMAAPLQIGYGTAIVSFLGAVHWGAAMQSRKGHTTKIMFERYIWGVIPGLCAFPANAMSVGTGSSIITMSLFAAFAVDAKFAWKGALPAWYMYLRVPLTCGASGAMLLTMWHAMYEEQLIADFEHAVVSEPLAVEIEPDAVMMR